MSMSKTLHVNISGASLGYLLYENINVKPEQEGFLLGSFSESVTKSVTDAYASNIKIKNTVHITGVIPCDTPNAFYNEIGELLTDNLDELLTNQKHKVVAWFKYKSKTKRGFTFTVREKIIHEELSKYFKIPLVMFTCCILTSTPSKNSATESYSHAFITYSKEYSNYTYRLIPMHIENLGDVCHEYKQKMPVSENFLQLYTTIDTKKSVGDIINGLQEKLHVEVEKSLDELVTSEKKILELKEHADQLRLSIRKKKLLKKIKCVNSEQDETKQDFLLVETDFNVIQKCDEQSKVLIDVSETKTDSDYLAATDECIDEIFSKMESKSTLKNSEEKIQNTNDVNVLATSLENAGDPADSGAVCTQLIDLTLSGDEEIPTTQPPQKKKIENRRKVMKTRSKK